MTITHPATTTVDLEVATSIRLRVTKSISPGFVAASAASTPCIQLGRTTWKSGLLLPVPAQLLAGEAIPTIRPARTAISTAPAFLGGSDLSILLPLLLQGADTGLAGGITKTPPSVASTTALRTRVLVARTILADASSRGLTQRCKKSQRCCREKPKVKEMLCLLCSACQVHRSLEKKNQEGVAALALRLFHGDTFFTLDVEHAQGVSQKPERCKEGCSPPQPHGLSSNVSVPPASLPSPVSRKLLYKQRAGNLKDRTEDHYIGFRNCTYCTRSCCETEQTFSQHSTALAITSVHPHVVQRQQTLHT